MLFSTNATAQDDAPPPATGTVELEPQLGVNLRYRYMFVPNGILDSWYTDSDTPGAQPYDRPTISSQVFGLEFAVEPAPASFLIYAEYWKINLDEGYWDDLDDGVQVFTDGDWLQPNGLGVVGLGVDFGHEFQVSNPAQDVWVGFRMGGGLGLGIVTGEVKQWHAGATFSTDPTTNCEPNRYAFDRHSMCTTEDETLNLPPVLPLLDMDLGWRVHFGDNMLLRLDTGLHSMVYFGAGLGATW
jgi:hypothetical protein